MEERLDMKYTSTGLYNIVQYAIGSEEIVDVRRMVDELRSKLECIENGGPYGHDLLRSGSMAEGFYFRTSDVDLMVVYKTIIVGMDRIGIMTNNSIPNREHFRMETDHTRPGFCLLRFVSHTRIIGISQDITEMLVNFHNNFYLSSLLWRDATTKRYIENGTTHGPCENGIFGGFDTDIAHSLKCQGWPRSAYPCLRRLARIKWPSFGMLSSIVNSGCHIVPIGDKYSDKEIIEWRLSFSEAEKTLIHEMNHCQFLTYGLLKMFHKEVINKKPDVHDLLCSYFLKTVVFWEIVYNEAVWVQNEFLKWFWICFRRLLSWVSNGYCPNFFIPENNMFLGKIQGRPQKDLLRHLATLYRMGYKCLLGCSFYAQYHNLLSQGISNLKVPSASLKEQFDFFIIYKLFNALKCSKDPHKIYKNIVYLYNNIGQNESYTKVFVINTLMRYRLQQLIFTAAQKWSLPQSYSSNKMLYKTIVKNLNSLKRTKWDVSAHSILSAIILFKQGMHQHTIKKVSNILERLKCPYVIHRGDEEYMMSQYRKLGGNFTPVDVMVETFFVQEIEFGDIDGLPELSLEHKCTEQHILYPPLVLLHFILFLSYQYVSMYNEANLILNDLTILINHGQIHEVNRNISWELLGICQEMAGRYGDAHNSYQNALKEPYYSFFRKATLLRIQNLFLKLNNL